MSSEVALAWTDNSDYEANYDVFRSTDSSPDFPTDYTRIAALSANVTTYTDTSPPGGLVHYAVRARNLTSNSIETKDTVRVPYFQSLQERISAATTRAEPLESFEDQNISEYSGGTSYFEVNNNRSIEGNYWLECLFPDFNYKTILSTSGLNKYPETNMRFSFWYRSVDSFDAHGFYFGVQTESLSSLTGYFVDLAPYNGNIVLARYDSGTYNSLDEQTVNWDTIWYRIDIDWKENGDISVNLYDSNADQVVANVSANDTNYTNGGIGWEQWSEGATSGFDFLLYRAENSLSLKTKKSISENTGSVVDFIINKVAGFSGVTQPLTQDITVVKDELSLPPEPDFNITKNQLQDVSIASNTYIRPSKLAVEVAIAQEETRKITNKIISQTVIGNLTRKAISKKILVFKDTFMIGKKKIKEKRVW